MAEKLPPDEPRFHLVDEPTGGEGEGLSSKEAGAFLRLLRPVVRVGQTLKEAARKAKGGT